ncbi:MAG: 4Fe-4S binding protein [Anaerolineae bacterium]|nr:4Fe-4S binding protein [Anaerolineae bacterium]
MAYVITSLCKMEAKCAEVCPVEAISKGETQYYINPDECIECGSCEAECPHEAIFHEDDVPAEYQAAIAENAAFYA